jgi:hypothetical protein
MLCMQNGFGMTNIFVYANMEHDHHVKFFNNENVVYRDSYSFSTYV